MTTIAEIQQTAEHKMNRTVETLREEFTKLRTGRASVGLLDHISVEYYGSMTPLSQVANLGVGDARTLTVQPWDRKMIPVIEKAILTSDLGLNPATSGEITKVVRSEGEDAKVAVRNLRRDANEQVKKLEKAKEVSEDDSRGAEKDIQKITDKYIEAIDKVVAEKEKEVMTV